MKNSLDLKFMFQPRSVALIGASTEPYKLSGRPFRFFREYGYRGNLYPVNPNYREIAGVTCFAKISEIPEEVDLAVITLPAAAVPTALEECGTKGVKAVAIISSGFAEVGGEGIHLQGELRRIASEFRMAVCGPNCSGFVYFPEKVTASFSVGLDAEFPKIGPVAFVSQSGALSSYILGAASERGLEFRYWITTGNECVLSFTDYLSYLIEDPEVRLVLGYLEDARDGCAFRSAARRSLILDKPLIIMKVGRSEAGAKASVSHTGSLVGSDEIYQVVFNENGVLRADNLDELFDLAILAQASRRPCGNRVQILSISGAAGILMADVGSESGLEFPDLSPVTKEALKGIMPSFATLGNPMDVTAEAVVRPALLRQAAEIIIKDPNVDNLVIFFGIVPGVHKKLAADIAQVASSTDKLVALIWFPLPQLDIWKSLIQADVPVFSEPVRGIQALGKMVRYVETRKRVLSQRDETTVRKSLSKPKLQKIIAKAKNLERKTLNEMEGKLLLKSCGIAVPRGGLAQNAEEAQSLAFNIGGPVAMKVCSPDILHKSEGGLTRLHLEGPEEVGRAFSEILAKLEKWKPQAKLAGVMVEEMIAGAAREVIVGIRQDDRFGPIVTFGSGGVLVEVLKDYTVWPTPLYLEEARQMIRSIRGYRILTAFRGRPAADIEALAQVLYLVGQIASQWQESIDELEINPLFVLPEGSGVIAGDALITLR